MPMVLLEAEPSSLPLLERDVLSTQPTSALEDEVNGVMVTNVMLKVTDQSKAFQIPL